MYEEEWGEIVIDWLTEDYALKKKLRRKNTNIFEQLQELGFPGINVKISMYTFDYIKMYNLVEFI